MNGEKILKYGGFIITTAIIIIWGRYQGRYLPLIAPAKADVYWTRGVGTGQFLQRNQAGQYPILKLSWLVINGLPLNMDFTESVYDPQTLMDDLKKGKEGVRTGSILNTFGWGGYREGKSTVAYFALRGRESMTTTVGRMEVENRKLDAMLQILAAGGQVYDLTQDKELQHPRNAQCRLSLEGEWGPFRFKVLDCRLPIGEGCARDFFNQNLSAQGWLAKPGADKMDTDFSCYTKHGKDCYIYFEDGHKGRSTEYTIAVIQPIN